MSQDFLKNMLSKLGIRLNHTQAGELVVYGFFALICLTIKTLMIGFHFNSQYDGNTSKALISFLEYWFTLCMFVPILLYIHGDAFGTHVHYFVKDAGKADKMIASIREYFLLSRNTWKFLIVLMIYFMFFAIMHIVAQSFLFQ